MCEVNVECCYVKENLLTDYDYFVYFGEIEETSYSLLTDALEKKKEQSQNTKGYFIPITAGGSPDAAYRMARALGHHYPDDLRIFIPDVCKSAGTLIAIGANELIISDRGELGPLDVQFQKKEELFEMSSGLDIIQSILALQGQVKDAFKDYLIDIRIGSGLGTKIASKLASDMASSLVAPISSQIDPVRIGEHHRALRVATAYGKRLSNKFKNTNEESITKLIVGYPSHRFVIDRKEATELFHRVRAPDDNESAIEQWLRKETNSFSGLASANPGAVCLNDLLKDADPDEDEVKSDEERDDSEGGHRSPDNVQDIGESVTKDKG